MGEGIKKSWASGTRKKPVNVIISEEKRAKITLAAKSHWSSPASAITRKKISDSKIYIPQVLPWKAIGEENSFAKSFKIRGPNGIVYKARNIIHFVRNNEHLFEEKTLVPHKSSKGRITRSCNAASGLTSVINGKKLSWYGWTAVIESEKKDLLNRKII